MKKKKHLTYLINIFLTITIFLIALSINKIYPFGNNALGKSDAIVMFKPMLYEFISKIKTGTLLNYTFNNGLGASTFFNFIYDLASPLNLIALLFKNPDLMYLSSILLKIIITSICMTFYASKKNNNTIIVIIATLAYVFCSWFISYYYYLPWLDVFMIFPLFQYSLEKLLDENKYHLYIFCLSYMIITSLYICFSVCIYTIIYFVIYRLLYKKDSLKKKILSFDYIALATIASLFLSFFFLYIWYDSLLKIKIGFDNFSSAPYTVSILDFLKSFYYSNISYITKMEGKTFPNIACISIILLNCIYYLINNKNIRNKLFVVGSFIVAVAIIFVPQLDFIMNAFHQIRGLTYRYSFILSFLMISLFISNVKNLNSINKKNLIISTIILLICLFITSNNISKEILIINIVFILSYSTLLFLYNNNRIHKLLILLIVVLQIIITTKNDFNNYILDREIPDNIVFKKENENFRINNSIENAETAGLYNTYCNNKTTYMFSSLTYSKVIYLFRDLGNVTFDNTYAVMYDYNKIPTLLFNVKSTQNNYYLEKIYAANKNIKKTIISEYDTKYTQENIIKNMTNIDNIFDKKIIKGYLENDEMIYPIDYDYYFIEQGNLTYFGTSNKASSKSLNDQLTIYVVNDEKLKEAYDYLAKNQIKYTYYNDNHLKGTINVDKDQLIFTSIPYDKDWEVKIDGKKVEPIELLDSLLGIETTEGIHEIELEYKTHYLIPALISISTLVILIIDYLKKRTKQIT